MRGWAENACSFRPLALPSGGRCGKMIEVLQGYRHPLIAKLLLVQQDYAGYDPKSQDETEMREQDKGFGDRASRETREVLVDEMLGARQWRRSKLGYLTGIGTLSETIRGPGAPIGGAGGRLAPLAPGVRLAERGVVEGFVRTL